tara:strand:+ start:2036 stop:2332 length:297 start_codon:yes stop_codon:yes gene_type:complete
MELEMILRISAVIIAATLLFGNIDLSYWKNKVKGWFPKKVKPIITPIDEIDGVDEKPFLEIVDLWYSLKEKCTEEGLDQAAEKLDEVFPLFNAENNDD